MAEQPRCGVCGRFLTPHSYMTNEHLDSEETYWKCSLKHSVLSQKEEG